MAVYALTIVSFNLVADEPAPERVVLHDAYYLDHFWAVIDTVATLYNHVLSFDEHRYIKMLRNLSADALCLYVRLVNRKGPYFRVAKLHYLPPVSLHNAIAELTRAKCVGLVTACAGDCQTILALSTLPELKARLSDATAKKLGKAELCTWLHAQKDWTDFYQALLDDHPVICLGETPWDFFKFLYFGMLVPNLSDFVVQALGHVTTETIDDTHLTSRFATRAEADDCYRIHVLYDAFCAVRHDLAGAELVQWWQTHKILRDDLHISAHDRYDRLIGRLGRIIERSDGAAAIDIYRHSPCAPSRERLVKLLLKDGCRDETLAVCAAGLAAPCDAEEHYALQQIWNRHHKHDKRAQATQILKDYPTVTLDWTEKTVEQAALAHYETLGWQGVHSENWLWCNLFGLLFWDIVFDAAQGGFHNPLQTAPHNLFRPGFFKARMTDIDARLAILQDTVQSIAHITDCHAQKNGIANPFVAWHPETVSMLETMLRHVPAQGLTGILKTMCDDLNVGCRGFPDLFLWRQDEDARSYQFIEVKSATDRILPQQFNWLQIFQRHGVTISVLRVNRPSQ